LGGSSPFREIEGDIEVRQIAAEKLGALVKTTKDWPSLQTHIDKAKSNEDNSFSFNSPQTFNGPGMGDYPVWLEWHQAPFHRTRGREGTHVRVPLPNKFLLTGFTVGIPTFGAYKIDAMCHADAVQTIGSAALWPRARRHEAPIPARSAPLQQVQVEKSPRRWIDSRRRDPHPWLLDKG
jgi:hypothetical protein